MKMVRAIVFAAFAASPVAAAHAADLVDAGVAPSFGVGPGVVAGPLTIYDFEPGTYVRAWFVPPWRNRHYFPSSGQAPIIGRDEVLDDRDAEPPQTFYRSWSNEPALRSEMLPGNAPVPQK